MAQRNDTPADEELRRLVDEASEDELLALLGGSRLDETQLCRLLERKDLSSRLLERLAADKVWAHSYRVKLRMTRHPHTPRRIATRLLRELYLFDLVSVSLLPSAPGEVRRLAEELILARLPKLALGEKLALARRSPARIAGALLGEGNAPVVTLVLDNAMLTEAQVVRALAKEGLPAHVVKAIVRHPKWSYRRSVRLALIRNPQAPFASVLGFLADLPPGDLAELAGSSVVPPNLRQYLRQEVARRMRTRKSARQRSAD